MSAARFDPKGVSWLDAALACRERKAGCVALDRTERHGPACVDAMPVWTSR